MGPIFVYSDHQLELKVEEASLQSIQRPPHSCAGRFAHLHGLSGPHRQVSLRPLSYKSVIYANDDNHIPAAGMFSSYSSAFQRTQPLPNLHPSCRILCVGLIN